MPEFNPEEERVAIATFPTKPAGLECTAELWLASNMTKVATSGEIPFTATGGEKSISLPITLPGVEGTYPVYLYVFSNAQRIAAFRSDEDVVIMPAAPPGFSFGRPVVTVKADFMMPGFNCAEIRCVVTNPSGSTQTRIIKCGAKKVIEPWKMGYRAWGTSGGQEKSLTLAPGDSATLTSPSHWWDTSLPYWRTNYPAISSPGSQYYAWMEDDLGNKSIDVMFDRSG